MDQRELELRETRFLPFLNSALLLRLCLPPLRLWLLLLLLGLAFLLLCGLSLFFCRTDRELDLDRFRWFLRG